MQHRIGAHALLADGRTAALVAPDGDVAWLCWPRIDSPPLLLALLDAGRGGRFTLRPADPGARLAERRYVPGTLVLQTRWEVPGGASLLVEEALLWDGPRSLVRTLRSDGPVEAVAQFSPAFDAARAGADLRVDEDGVVARGADLTLRLRTPPGWRWRTTDGALQARTTVTGEGTWLALHDAGIPASSARDRPDVALAATRDTWTARTAPATRGATTGTLGEAALDTTRLAAMLRTAACVLLGLHRRGGGIVAAPTTSIPQWPGSSRTWDYRYAWMRDTALAAMALLRLGLVDQAAALGAFCGDHCGEGLPPALLRVDGGVPPPEHTLDHLAGHGGARPVRIGNAAAEQRQLDVPGELLDLAWSLHRAGALPEALRRAAPRLADTALRHAADADHGIWEIRGVPRHYTHSRVMTWTALRRAAQLAAAGAISGDVGAWEAGARSLHAEVLSRCTDATGALTLHEGGGGADAALALAPLLGFLPRGARHVSATLDNISANLSQSDLVHRYEGSQDGVVDPCAPFVFPTCWYAAARARCGGDGRAALRAAAATCGPLGLHGEVVDPRDGAPLGNYPQVQSHAALVMAALTPLASASAR